MSLLDFLRIIYRNGIWMALCAISLAGLTWASLKNQAPQYSSHSVINTGLVSAYTIESNEGGTIDYAFTNNELQNIINVATSYHTMEELGLRLLAHALLKGDSAQILLPENRKELEENLGAKVVKKLRESPLGTMAAIVKMRDHDRENVVYKLLYSDHPLFGIEHLQKIKVERHGNSDMLHIAYSTIDPGICQLTLQMLAEIMMSTQLSLKKGQSGDVLDFFEEATQKSASELRMAENDLLRFNVSNRIINYGEQTRFISGKKEDIDELLYKELMNLASADSTMQRLEVQLRERINIPKLNRSIMDQRKALADLSAKISTMEILPDSTAEFSAADLRKLKRQAEKMRGDIRETVDETWVNSNMPEGLPVRDVLNQWLNSVLRMEESTARLQVIHKRQKEFIKIYDMFAPWGSTIRRMERQIDVNERAYLENLHSYNQARLHQINMMMSSNLKIIDKPVFPNKPEADKKMMFVIMAFMAGIFLPLGLFIALHLMDQSLNSVQRAEEKTNLKLASAMPFVDKFKMGRYSRINFASINHRAMEQLVYALRFDATSVPSPVIGFFSTRNGEGKTWLIDRLTAFMEKKGCQVIRLKPSEWIARKAEFEQRLLQTPSWVFIEFPSLLEQSDFIAVMDDVHCSLLVSYARKVWSKADERALARLHQVAKTPLHLFLNALAIDQMEDVIGEVPKRRNLPRRWLKRMVTLQYS